MVTLSSVSRPGVVSCDFERSVLETLVLRCFVTSIARCISPCIVVVVTDRLGCILPV